MRDKVTTKRTGENSMVFSDSSRRSVRVVYEPDGTPLYCASDMAACMGYEAPTKAIARAGIRPQYRRFVPWVSKRKRGRSEAICFDRDGVERLLEHGVPSEEFEVWVLEDLIPRAEAIGREMVYRYEEPTPEPQGERDATPSGIEDLLDAIMLDVLMLKKAVRQGL